MVQILSEHLSEKLGFDNGHGFTDQTKSEMEKSRCRV